MGNLLGRNRSAPQNDPFYSAIPPPEPFVGNPGPTGGNDPYGEYGYSYEPQPGPGLASYGGRRAPRTASYGGRYAQGKPGE